MHNSRSIPRRGASAVVLIALLGSLSLASSQPATAASGRGTSSVETKPSSFAKLFKSRTPKLNQAEKNRQIFSVGGRIGAWHDSSLHDVAAQIADARSGTFHLIVEVPSPYGLRRTNFVVRRGPLGVRFYRERLDAYAKDATRPEITDYPLLYGNKRSAELIRGYFGPHASESAQVFRESASADQ